MSTSPSHFDGRVAVFVDCDNVSPDILDHALLMAAQFGRSVLRRGYGNSGALGSRWQEALVRQAFTPHLQFKYAPGKNTADIALALDALEAMFDERAQTFFLVTSDSDFSYLCRKLRERGATVCIVGESKTPEALRNASDQFFEWIRESAEENARTGTGDEFVAKIETAPKLEASKADSVRSIPKRRPRFVVDAVELLAGATPDGKVTLSGLGLYLRRTDPAFSPHTYGHSGLLNMLKTYDLLLLKQENGGHWSVSPKPPSN
ncbi:NYN domain-containing protein [Lysobacter enzymogenes]|nr:NYN domain-containing protein [Lysobacter enzymogenes]QCW24390.1 NYN domain-containing protein [Lysobacter enzymogenes]